MNSATSAAAGQPDVATSGDMPAAEASIDRLAWLTGCWKSEVAEAGSGEHWMAPAGHTMLGMSRTVRNGATVAHEFLQIRPGEDGRLVYIAEPSGQHRTIFPLLQLGAAEAVFENRQHDFPQRVIYRLVDGDRLAASIEGTWNGALRVVEFPMRRVRCEEAWNKAVDGEPAIELPNGSHSSA